MKNRKYRNTLSSFYGFNISNSFLILILTLTLTILNLKKAGGQCTDPCTNNNDIELTVFEYPGFPIIPVEVCNPNDDYNFSVICANASQEDIVLTAFEIESENGIEVYNFEMPGYSPSTFNNCDAEVISTITLVGNCYTIALASLIPKSSMPDDCSIAVNQSVSNTMQFFVEVL